MYTYKINSIEVMFTIRWNQLIFNISSFNIFHINHPHFISVILVGCTHACMNACMLSCIIQIAIISVRQVDKRFFLFCFISSLVHLGLYICEIKKGGWMRKQMGRKSSSCITVFLSRHKEHGIFKFLNSGHESSD